MFLAALLMQANDVATGLDKATPIENWQVISALILPLIMAVIIQSSWSRGLQATATMVVALVWTFVYQILTDQSMVIPEIVVRGLELFALAIPFYYGLYKPTGIAPKIEAATSG